MKHSQFTHKSATLNSNAHQLFTEDYWKNIQCEQEYKKNETQHIYPIISCCNISMKCVHHKPNIFVIDNFLTNVEVNHLLNISRTNITKFEPSFTQSSNSLSQRIYSSKRTSTCIFLQKSMDKIVSSIENRAANIIGVSTKNVEQLQIVRYTNGQHFNLHHDAGTLINETLRRKQINNNNIQDITHSTKTRLEESAEYSPPCKMRIDDKRDNIDSTNKVLEECKEYSIDIMLPSRICSFFVYLTSMSPGSGGETYFPKIGVKIQPQRGTAVLWCNVNPNNVFQADPMLIHRADPVKGNHEKIGMNIWLQHL